MTVKRFLKQALICVLAIPIYILFPIVWVFMHLIEWAFELDRDKS